jgi:hypothetical protein
VIITGTLHKQIFFVADDDIVRHMGEDLPFTTFVDLPGIQPGDSVTVNPVVEHVSFELIDRAGGTEPAGDFDCADPYVEEPESPTFRRLIQRTVIQLVVRGSEEQAIRVATAPVATVVAAV